MKVRLYNVREVRARAFRSAKSLSLINNIPGYPVSFFLKGCEVGSIFIRGVPLAVDLRCNLHDESAKSGAAFSSHSSTPPHKRSSVTGLDDFSLSA